MMKMDPKCKYSEWRSVNNRDDRDFVCVKWSWCGTRECYCDEYCRHYEPEEEIEDEIIME